MTRHVPMPIEQLFQIKGTCEDCGRRHVWNRHDIAREQTRRGLATPEELGSYLRCSHCRERGGKGRNVSVRLVASNGVVTELLRDLRPLSAVSYVAGECGNCGRTARFGPEKLAAFPAELTVHDLWLRAVCGSCKAQGGPPVRMTIEVDPPMRLPSRSAEKVEWSKKTVFGEDRSDPFYSLPRRKLAKEDA